MAAEKGGDGASTAGSSETAQPGPFVLRSLLDDVPLSADGSDQDIQITSVEYYDGNLYVGTSASELLHFFQIPPDPNDDSDASTFILASRLSPPFADSQQQRPGVQQIVLLPSVGKACVRCNWTVTFYSLPELTPVFREVKNCNWIGDPTTVPPPPSSQASAPPRATILLSLNRRLQLVRVGDVAHAVKNIDFAGSIRSARHDVIACVADARSYALVHVEHQLKIPLMNISSLDVPSRSGGSGPAPAALGQPLHLSTSEAADGSGGLSRSSSTALAHRSAPHAAQQQPQHSRSTSLGGLIAGSMHQHPQQRQPSPRGVDADRLDSSRPASMASSPGAAPSPAAAATAAAASSSRSSEEVGSDEASRIRQTVHMPPAAHATATLQRPAPGLLAPLIASPTAEEFLLVTGTGPSDPGIGMFVNLDGDPTRPTLEFTRYPTMIVVDGGSASTAAGGDGSLGGDDDSGYVLAAMSKDFSDGLHSGLEIQRWDVNHGEDEPTKWWLETPSSSTSSSSSIGVQSLTSSQESLVREVVEKLRQRRVSLSATSTPSPADSSASASASASAAAGATDGDASRNKSETAFASRLAKTTGRIAVWSGNHIWWLMRNPLVLQLEAELAAAAADNTPPLTPEQRAQLFTILGSIRGRDARNELEFVTLSYIRQKAGGLLFMGLLQQHQHESVDSAAPFSDGELKALEEVMLDSGLDPRVVLALVPGLRAEVVMDSRQGIWIFGGMKDIVERYLTLEKTRGKTSEKNENEAVASLPPTVLQFLRRFLIAWRRKKGFGSVADEGDVFRSVDAALLAVLLQLDRETPRGTVAVKPGSVRADLNDVVDRGVDCFERAVALLKDHRRLFVLSRLYQSRKQAADVLATWRRIVEGGPDVDAGGELQDGELRIREYLAKVSSQALVQENGLWLARRNPRLGVQVFADDRARAPHFEPAHVVPLLRAEAPGAVRYYLEYLVFGKGGGGGGGGGSGSADKADMADIAAYHVDELIAYYVDVVADSLRTSEAARSTMLAAYEAYRALQPPPKPSFHRFLAENTLPDDEVAQCRLRLLELLSGPHAFDVAAVRTGLDKALSGVFGGEQETGDKAAGKKTREERLTADELLIPETIILNGREHRHKDALRLLVHGLGDYDTAVSYCVRGGASLYGVVVAGGSGGSGGSGGGGSGDGKKAKGQAQAKPPSRRQSLPPTAEEQSRLFWVLLVEFMAIEDVSDRIEQTSQLLRRFSSHFDVLEVLRLLPDSWAVSIAAGFLAHALKQLVRDRHESTIARALSGAENLRIHDELITQIQAMGPQVEEG